MTRGPYVGRGLLGIAAIVVLGAALAEMGATRGAGGEESAVSHAGRLDAFAFMGRHEERVVTGAFRGGDAVAVMGRLDVDLREAEMEGDSAVIDVRVAMGRVDLRVPDHWAVSSNLGPGLGGASTIRAARPEARAGAPVLTLRGPMLMGAVVVGN